MRWNSGPHSKPPGQLDLLCMLIASLWDKSNANEINSNLGQSNLWTRQFLLGDRSLEGFWRVCEAKDEVMVYKEKLGLRVQTFLQFCRRTCHILLWVWSRSRSIINQMQQTSSSYLNYHTLKCACLWSRECIFNAVSHRNICTCTQRHTNRDFSMQYDL